MENSLIQNFKDLQLFSESEPTLIKVWGVFDGFEQIGCFSWTQPTDELKLIRQMAVF